MIEHRWSVPPLVNVVFKGSLPKGVSGKDVILTLCGSFNHDEVLNCAIEFTGPGVTSLSIDDRLTISNMTTEWGALAGVFPVDSVTIQYLKSQSEKQPGNPRLSMDRIHQLEENPMNAEDGAVYFKTLTLDLSSVSPFVAGPNSVKLTRSISEFTKEVKITKAYLLSCTNARLSDLQSAAEIFKSYGPVHPNVQFYLAPASKWIRDEAIADGTWDTLLNAGAIVLPSGCGPCIGLGQGLLESKEVGISSTNRNYKGRMGHPESVCYLSNPAVVAASAVSGYITSPDHLESSSARVFKSPIVSMSVSSSNSPLDFDKEEEEIVEGFTRKVQGGIVFCNANNLNTDGIYPGKYTYQELMTPSQMASVVMENYDPSFSSTVKEGDFLVAGYNFGCGSSREQAATALVYAGVKLVIAASFSQTFKRNAINNGLLVLECPLLYETLAAKFMGGLTLRVDGELKIDLVDGVVAFDGVDFNVPKVGRVAQELMVAGGLESWVRSKLSPSSSSSSPSSSPSSST